MLLPHGFHTPAAHSTKTFSIDSFKVRFWIKIVILCLYAPGWQSWWLGEVLQLKPSIISIRSAEFRYTNLWKRFASANVFDTNTFLLSIYPDLHAFIILGFANFSKHHFHIVFQLLFATRSIFVLTKDLIKMTFIGKINVSSSLN